MRLLIFHGYLLHGTGSNVYNANLAAALRRLGHEVHLLCQDRAAAELEFVDAIGDWDAGELRVRALREPVRCTVYRPPIGRLLPVYVADRYEGFDARPFPELTEQQLEHYLDRNVAAVRDVVARAAPEGALANHLVMGPVILARALGGAAPYAVKIHGSALEYTVKPHPRFLPYAREGLAGAAAVLVGSRHTAQSLWAALGEQGLQARTRLGPPGVDVHTFGPRSAVEARAGLERLRREFAALAAQAPVVAAESSFAADPAAAHAALGRLDPDSDRLVAYVGKLLPGKGVDLLLLAWPLVLAAVPEALLLVVGFGDHGAALRRLADDLAAGDLDAAQRAAGVLSPPSVAFIARLGGERRERYLAVAATAGQRISFTGRLSHEQLADLLPLAEAQVVPSVFPESFGMVAAEAAACGALPIVAEHSGLAEVAAALGSGLDAPFAALLSFPLDAAAVPVLAERLIAWLRTPAQERERTRQTLVATVRERYSWEGVARGVLAAVVG